MPYIFFNLRKEMKKTLILLTVLFSIGFSKDFIKLGDEAYDKNNYQKAAELLKKACDGGMAYGCGNLGIVYAKQRNYSAAKKYYGKACDLKLPLACDRYKELNEKGY